MYFLFMTRQRFFELEIGTKVLRCAVQDKDGFFNIPHNLSLISVNKKNCNLMKDKDMMTVSAFPTAAKSINEAVKTD